MRRLRVLVVDDEPAIRKFVRANLEARGYDVLVAVDGVEAIRVFEAEQPDLLILDIMMPGMDGFEVCRNLREWSKVPIIILSARGAEEDKVKCLDIGADDYLTKPFGVAELLGRVKAVLRRTQESEAKSNQAVFKSGGLTVDFARHTVAVEGKDIELTATEYGIISYLALNAGRVLTTDQLLEKVWGEQYSGEYHLLQVNMGRLRKKLGDDARKPRYIQTRSSIGYLLTRET